MWLVPLRNSFRRRKKVRKSFRKRKKNLKC